MSFDYLMLHHEVGVARKLRRLTPPERWAAVAGVWCLAAKSPVSGALLVAYDVEVTAHDVAEQAGVTLAVARKTLEKLQELHELERDPELNAWVLEDWNRHQPAPKRAKPSDAPEERRERKRRSRAAKAADASDGHAHVTRVTPLAVTPSHAPEGEGEGEGEGEELPPHPLAGEQPETAARVKPPRPKHGGKVVNDLMAQRLHKALLAFDAEAQTHYAEKAVTAAGKWSSNASRILTALTAYPELDEQRCVAVIRAGLGRDAYWGPGKPEPRHVFGENVIDGLIEATSPQSAPLPAAEQVAARNARAEAMLA